MFDRKEIANRALLRAEEIKAERARRRRQINGVLCGAGVMVLVIAIMIVPNMNPSNILLVDDPIPLATMILPDKDAVPYNDPEFLLEFSIPGYDNIIIPADVSEVKITLLNPHDNPYWFSFEIVLNNETLYKSGLVAPSMCIENISLAKPLESGTHAATLIIRSYESGSPSVINKVSMDITITAE